MTNQNNSNQSLDKSTLNWVDNVVAQVMNRGDISRRTLMQGAGAGAAMAMLAACGTANEVVNGANDVATLNALLTAEYQAIAAYTAGAGILAAPAASDLQGIAPVVLGIAGNWLRHHSEHAEVLIDAINAAKGVAVKKEDVTFTAPAGLLAKQTVENVMILACNAERDAAVAYNGAVKALSVQSNRYLAASVGGDEAQHFVVLYVLLKGRVKPTAALTETVAKSGVVVPKSFLRTTGKFEGLDKFADIAVNDNA